MFSFFTGQLCHPSRSGSRTNDFTHHLIFGSHKYFHERNFTFSQYKILNLNFCMDNLLYNVCFWCAFGIRMYPVLQICTQWLFASGWCSKKSHESIGSVLFDCFIFVIYFVQFGVLECAVYVIETNDTATDQKINKELILHYTLVDFLIRLIIRSALHNKCNLFNRIYILNSIKEVEFIM